MAPSNLSISPIGPESDVLLRNLFEHYIHDMAEWFDIDTRADGSYSYDTSLVWQKGCDVYLAKAGDAIAGFAIVGPATEWVGENGVHDVREFFVIRRFRRRGLGQRMATLLWNERPGAWLVRSSKRMRRRSGFGDRRLQASRAGYMKKQFARSTGGPGDFSDSILPPSDRSEQKARRQAHTGRRRFPV
jgi:predicted acetyltransferase